MKVTICFCFYVEFKDAPSKPNPAQYPGDGADRTQQRFWPVLVEFFTNLLEILTQKNKFTMPSYSTAAASDYDLCAITKCIIIFMHGRVRCFWFLFPFPPLQTTQVTNK